VSKQKLLRRFGFFIMAALALVLLSGCEQYIVLDPKGPVAEVEYRMIVITTILCAIIVIPVLAIFAYIVYRFRDKPGNNAPYTPHWDDSKVLEAIWWGVPILIIGILGYYTARDTFALANPPKDEKPMVIQVSSMDWKWVFHYPDQNIATVNEVHIPVGKPVEFQVTADNAPMNSFWIPQIAGQTYTMPGMAMKLWAKADHAGQYFGSGANFTGKGFADMQFKVIAEDSAKLDQWVANVKQTKPALTLEGYEKLYSTKESVKNVQEYSSYPKGIFEERVLENGGDNHTGHFEHKEGAHGEKSQETTNK